MDRSSFKSVRIWTKLVLQCSFVRIIYEDLVLEFR